MKSLKTLRHSIATTGFALLALGGMTRTAAADAAAAAVPPAGPYKILNTAQFQGTGAIDYVYADSVGRKVYVPRGNAIQVFDLDTLKALPDIDSGGRARGVAVDPVSHHAFCSSNPVVMWDTETMKAIKSIRVQGSPDGINYEPLTQRIYVLSHTSPNVTVIDAKDGSIVGTVELGGAPEQSASDGMGHMYIDLEDQDSVAVVDVKTLKRTATYGLGGKGGGPSGLALDAKNGILFSFCASPATCVILSATDGKILDTLPIAAGIDGGGFNPATMEAFGSEGGGTGALTIIKENSATSFAVEQTVVTKSRAKTSTLDFKTGHIILITTEPLPAGTPIASGTTPTTPAVAPAPGGGGQRGGGQRGGGGPSLLDLIVVGK